LARLILDTTALVAVERGRSALEGVVGDGDDVAIAAVTAAELLVGVELANSRRRAAREAFVEAVLAELPVETYDLDTARAHATLLAHTRRSGRPRGAHNLVIAATALATERGVVTADGSGFADLPGVTVRAFA
jgi:tRNA(fMet)-specific endonuclease VapC